LRQSWGGKVLPSRFQKKEQEWTGAHFACEEVGGRLGSPVAVDHQSLSPLCGRLRLRVLGGRDQFDAKLRALQDGQDVSLERALDGQDDIPLCALAEREGVRRVRRLLGLALERLLLGVRLHDPGVERLDAPPG